MGSSGAVPRISTAPEDMLSGKGKSYLMSKQKAFYAPA